jgi:hypothetical protein
MHPLTPPSTHSQTHLNFNNTTTTTTGKRIMSSKRTETYQFTNLEQLREWLNLFDKIDLEAVLPIGDGIEIRWYENVLTDGSKAYDVSIITF